ncbi:EamA family transporter [Candidatus Roizmanbacteria bacterium]|nr:MAG: EamA family transporter [Candidatus Roizmanbacteria bacterium]
MSGIIAILTATIIWGAGSPIFKYALSDIPPFTLAFIRFFTASFIFLPLAVSHYKKMTPKLWWHLIMGAFWGISVNVSFFFLGLQLSPSINATIISSIGPILLYVLSLRLLKEKPHPQIIRGMVISLLGVLIIILAPLIKSTQLHMLTEQAGFSAFLGNLCFIAAMIGGIMITIDNKQLAGKVHPYTVTGFQFLIGSLAFVPFMFYELQSWSFQELTDKSWIGILYGVFLSSALAYFAQNYALTKLSAQKVGMFTYIMPVAAVLVAVPLLGEYPDIFFMLGAAAVFVGILVGERKVKSGRKS